MTIQYDCNKNEERVYFLFSKTKLKEGYIGQGYLTCQFILGPLMFAIVDRHPLKRTFVIRFGNKELFRFPSLAYYQRNTA